MSVEFHEENNFAQSQMYSPVPSSGLSNFIIKIGLAKDPAGAQKVLLGIAVIAIVLAIIIFAVFVF